MRGLVGIAKRGPVHRSIIGHKERTAHSSFHILPFAKPTLAQFLQAVMMSIRQAILMASPGQSTQSTGSVESHSHVLGQVEAMLFIDLTGRSKKDHSQLAFLVAHLTSSQ